MKKVNRSLLVISVIVVLGWFNTMVIGSLCQMLRINIDRNNVDLLSGLFVNFACSINFFVYSVLSLQLSLEFSFIFASEHHVIGIKQRPRDGLLKISCDGIHDDNKEEWGKRRTLVYPDRDGELHRGSSCSLNSTLWTRVENSHPLYELFGNSMMSQGVPYNFTRYAVKGLLQVEEGDMHCLLFLAMLLYQEASGVYGINGATTSHEAALIAGQLDECWRQSTTIPIWKKKGSPADCSNYRPIRLLPHSMKIFERIVDGRIRDKSARYPF
ncbi:unnamed protein product [Heligmosomoides polygyrus]|uniref:G_PROTEIN_RECEP_F1_2 domain-containing protein n=1 Tax=Heligmosomoides polygyrus TaxID=6339 RepID=A0A183GRP3_HELPZ|nr:unnamed protein product [Heligmosomoides polygyrus]